MHPPMHPFIHPCCRFNVTIGPYKLGARGSASRRVSMDVLFPHYLPGHLNPLACAKMQQWAGGQPLEYPPLPIIRGVGVVPYHSECDFSTRRAELWVPEDLRRYLQAREINARAHHQMEAYIDDSTGEFVDGLVDLVTSILSLPEDARPQPLSLAQAEEFGHIDPTMWEYTDNAELTLKDNFAEVMSCVRRLKITADTITDRFASCHACLLHLTTFTNTIAHSGLMSAMKTAAAQSS